MGVPKFYRYISERYPCLSEMVREYQLPEFDNLYLDMNGIIHMCSHPDDNNPHFRITEEKIFQDIFHYLEVLFRMIRPQKLFFMAVDGVAPRAKMNQQRGRRFRSAKDAEKMIKEALAKGEDLPNMARFDSNCITPGTPFMCRLHEQLKYFVVSKISTDPLWKKCKVILSGHETPGEGEHKIMDYIRYMRAQPTYDPNTRHCLYGLDADLIMLGLCTHEPHFSLLREEVRFGKKSTKRLSVPEEIRFFLLHLSLMREYLELEFKSLESQLKGFDYDFEKIIDDWVLMGFLVGNDFIPHLPNLHIHDGALPLLYKTYAEVLPDLGGYINENGALNLERFEKFMQKLADVDYSSFEDYMEDKAYMESKTGRRQQARQVKERAGRLEEWQADETDGFVGESLQPETALLFGDDDQFEKMIQQVDELELEKSAPQESKDDEPVKHAVDIDLDEEDDEDLFDMFKRNYYRNKMQYVDVTADVMRQQAEGYVRAIQWNLNYYYNGCCSWSWYYPHHYAPYISDIKDFTNMKIEFDLGHPFKPFEQLLAVLPPASKDLLPPVYHGLMTHANSSIKEYYPEDFQTDLNGKRQEWEAVVLIPFIDEKLLLDAMDTCNGNLSDEERDRNKHGPMHVYEHIEKDLGIYKAPEYFNTIAENHAKLTNLSPQDIWVPVEKLIKGAYPDSLPNIYYPGFPTMKHLKYEGVLKKGKVNVFDQPSRSDNMIIKILKEKDGDELPVDLLGRTVWVGWPHLVEAKLVAISNKNRIYRNIGGPGQYDLEEKSDKDNYFDHQASTILDHYKSRLGIECGEAKVLLHTQVIVGRQYVFTENGRFTLTKVFAQVESCYPLQAVVLNLKAHDSQGSPFREIGSLFPVGSECFIITNPYYGQCGTVLDSSETLKSGRLKLSLKVTNEPDFTPVWEKHRNNFYMTAYKAGQRLGMSAFMFAKITGQVFVTVPNKEGGLRNVNIGLDLKLNKRNKEVPGYTRKENNKWCYSQRSVDLVRDYQAKYPHVCDVIASENHSFDNPITGEELFGEEWEVLMKELTAYLKNLPSQSVPKRTCGSQAFDKDVTEDLEALVDEYIKKRETKSIVIQVKPSFLYTPDVQTTTCMPDPKMQAEILDRVVNVRLGYTVPFGMKGTIIAINEAESGSERDVMYDVVFDEPFTGGLALNCSEGRGYSLPNTAFINLTHGKRLFEEKTGKKDKFMPKQQDPGAFFGTNSAFAQFQQPKNDFRSARSAENQKQPVLLKKNGAGPANAGAWRQEAKHSPQQNYPSKSMPKENVPAKPASSTKPPQQTVDTDMLKKMLNIGGTNPGPLKPEKGFTGAQHTGNKLNISDIFAGSLKEPATARLLTYYQSNRIGCPRYQYITEAGHKVSAQLCLPNGRVVIGRACANREEASERVAEEALKLFLTKSTELPVQSFTSMPIPPQNWFQQTGFNSQNSQKSAPQPTSPQKPHPNKNHVKNHHHNKGHDGTAFVPMQVMKKNIPPRNPASNPQKVARENQMPLNQPVSVEKEHKKQGHHHSKKKTDQSGGQRKTRIAANFGNN